MAVLGATRTEFAADSPSRTAWAAELIAQNVATIDVPFQIYMAEATTNAIDPGVVLGSFVLPIPDYVGLIQGYINLKLEIKTAVTYNGQFKLRNITDTLEGTWTNTNNVNYEENTDKVQIGLAADTNRPTTIEIWGRANSTSGLLSCRSILGLTAWFSVS